MWQHEKNKEFISKRKVLENVSRFYEGSIITVIRPAMIKFPILDKLSIPFTHKREIRKQIEDFHPDIILGLGILNNYYAIKEAKKQGIPFIYYLIDTLHRLLDSKLYRFVAKRYEKKNIINADYVLTINRELKKYAIDMGCDPYKIEVVPAGIDLSFFEPSIDRQKIREKYGVNENDFVIFFMGWLYNFSGLMEVSKELLNNDYGNIKLFIVGDGDLYEPLLKLSKEYENNDKIILVGRRPYKEIPFLLQIADVCILPAYNNDVMKDIVPIKMYEYMASGKPVICTKLDGLVSEFGHDSGIIYINSPKELLKNVIKLKEDKYLLQKLGNKAKKFVDSNEWENITKKFENILYTHARFPPYMEVMIEYNE